jgi:hypothetical protein
MKLVKIVNLMRYWQDGGLTLQELSSLGPALYKKGQPREIIFFLKAYNLISTSGMHDEGFCNVIMHVVTRNEIQVI